MMRKAARRTAWANSILKASFSVEDKDKKSQIPVKESGWGGGITLVRPLTPFVIHIVRISIPQVLNIMQLGKLRNLQDKL